MSFYDFFWFGFNLTSSPNKICKRGWEDALAGNPKYQFKLAFLFQTFRRTQELYDRGYNDGQNERIIRKF